MPDTTTSLAEVKISELPVADQANTTDLLEASQVAGPQFTSRKITLDQVSTVVAASDQISDVIDAAIGALPPPVSDWNDITGKPATFPPTVPIAYSDISGKPSTFPPDPEAVDDRVAALLVAGTNVTLSYNDAANSLTINSTAAGGGGGTVTSTSVVSANGLAGTVATPTTTPAITLSTTVTGMLKGNGTALSAATAGTDYMTPGNVSAAYQPLDADLTALAGLNATAGLVEQTGAAAFTKRLIGVANTTDVLTRANGDARYLGIAASAPPSGTAGGDLSGSYPNPLIKPSVTNGQVLTTVAGVAAWAAASGGGAGDFYATHVGALTIPSTLSKISPTTVVSGNAGGWYSAGRYTPPAGRYRIHAAFSASDSIAASVIQLSLLKNGAQIGYSSDTTAAAGYSCNPVVDVIADSNGTDYFEMWGQGNTGTSASANSISFLAFPLTGMQGPQGLMPTGNYWRQLKRIVPTASQASVDFAGADIPSDINDLQCTFDLAPTTNDAALLMNFYDNVGVLDLAAHHNWSISLANSAAAGGAASQLMTSGATSLTTTISLCYVSATTQVANLATTAIAGIRGDLTIPNIRDAARSKTVNFRNSYVNAVVGGTFGIVGSGHRTIVGAITGFRLYFSPGTIAGGGAVTLWGSP